MKKIFNWTFGSIFRTFGRIIAYLIIGSLFGLILSKSGFKISSLFLDKVSASTSNTSYSTITELEFPTSAWLNRNSDSIGTGVINLQSIMYNNANGVQMAYFANYGTMNSNTTDNYYLTIGTPTSFVANHVYAYTIYVKALLPNESEGNYPVSPNDVYDVDMYYTGTNMSNSNTRLDFFGTMYVGELYMSIDYNTDFESNVYALVYIMKTNYNGNYIRVPIKFNQGANNFRFYGYKLQDLGYSSDYLQSLITSSGLATARSVQEVQQELDGIDNTIQNQTQTIINTTNQTQQTIINSTNQTINTITDSSSPDLNGTLDNNTIAGWLPAGPVDSIITLPLTLLNSLFNAMGGTCADLVVPLPFVNKNLNIPCMSGVYTNMGFGSFFNWIGVIASAFILYKYLLKLYKWIDDTLTLRENTQVDWGGD